VFVRSVSSVDKGYGSRIGARERLVEVGLVYCKGNLVGGCGNRSQGSIGHHRVCCCYLCCIVGRCRSCIAADCIVDVGIGLTRDGTFHSGGFHVHSKSRSVVGEGR